METPLQGYWVRLNEGPPLTTEAEWINFLCALATDDSGVTHFLEFDRDTQGRVVTALREARHWVPGFIVERLLASRVGGLSRNVLQSLESVAETANGEFGLFLDRLEKIWSQLRGQTEELDLMLASAEAVRERLKSLSSARELLAQRKQALLRSKQGDKYKQVEDTAREIALLEAELSMLQGQPARVYEDIDRLNRALDDMKNELMVAEGKRQQLVLDLHAEETRCAAVCVFVDKLDRKVQEARNARKGDLREIGAVLGAFLRDHERELEGELAEIRRYLASTEAMEENRVALKRERARRDALAEIQANLEFALRKIRADLQLTEEGVARSEQELTGIIRKQLGGIPNLDDIVARVAAQTAFRDSQLQEKEQLEKELQDLGRENKVLERQITALADAEVELRARRTELEERLRSSRANAGVVTSTVLDGLEARSVAFDLDIIDWVMAVAQSKETLVPHQGDVADEIVAALATCIKPQPQGETQECRWLSRRLLPLAWRDEIPDPSSFLRDPARVSKRRPESFHESERGEVTGVLETMFKRATEQREHFDAGRFTHDHSSLTLLLTGEGRMLDDRNNFSAVKCAELLLEYAYKLGWAVLKGLAWKDIALAFSESGSDNNRYVSISLHPRGGRLQVNPSGAHPTRQGFNVLLQRWFSGGNTKDVIRLDFKALPSPSDNEKSANKTDRDERQARHKGR